MTEFAHHHPGQSEPRSHGETHHENRIVDLNTAPEQELADLPMIGPDRARALCNARPFKSWDQVEKLPGFGAGMIDDLKSGGAQLGSPQD
jgi:DNA uptake protein ComE-like DNA-binding protein